MTDNAELKPCPFCGSEPQINLRYDNSGIYCANDMTCGVQPEIYFDCSNATDHKEAAIRYWNTRPTPQTPGDVVEVMWKALKVSGCKAALPKDVQAALTAAASLGYHLTKTGDGK